MSSNRNAVNHNLFRGYQKYVEYYRQTFPFATPPSHQEWNATFFGSIHHHQRHHYHAASVSCHRHQATTTLFCHHHQAVITTLLCHQHQPVKMWRERTKIQVAPGLIQIK